MSFESPARPRRPATPERPHVLASARRVVVKIGTAVLSGETGDQALARCGALVASVAAMRATGREVLVVTSGAVWLGARRLAVASGEPHLRPACAAVGQAQLMALYQEAFERVGLVPAQVLLTCEDLAAPRRLLHLRETLRALLAHGAVPVINENDAVTAVRPDAEPRDGARAFGDNDRLAARLAAAAHADVLLILTDVDGLHTADPRLRPDARLLAVVPRVTATVRRVAGGAHAGRGGMLSKVEAAAFATRRGCHTIVANGRRAGVLDRLAAGEPLGTLFLAAPRPAAAPAARAARELAAG